MENERTGERENMNGAGQKTPGGSKNRRKEISKR